MIIDNKSINDDDFELAPTIEEEVAEEEEIITLNVERLNFKDFPYIIKSKILYKALLFLIINLIIVLTTIFIAFEIEIIFILGLIDFYMVTDILFYYNTMKYMQCRIFEGYVIGIDNIGLPGTSDRRKKITIGETDSDKVVSFEYFGKSKVGIGFPVVLYLNKNAAVELKDDIPHISNILAVSFKSLSDDEAFEQKSEMKISEFLESK